VNADNVPVDLNELTKVFSNFSTQEFMVLLFFALQFVLGLFSRYEQIILVGSVTRNCSVKGGNGFFSKFLLFLDVGEGLGSVRVWGGGTRCEC
jgi:hypothetical protein